MHHPSECHEIRKQFDLSDLRLTEMNEAEKAQVENHFHTCKQCQNWMSEWELIKFEARELPELEVPTSVLANVMTAIESGPERSFLSEFALPISAFALLIVALTVYAGEAAEGTLSWCVSFLILLAVNQFAKPKAIEVSVRAQ